jgi:hypothetical protein
MLYTMSYQMYKYEHGLITAAEQRAADARAGEAAAALAAALADLRLRLARALRLGRRVRPAREAADAVTAQARVMPGAR